MKLEALDNIDRFIILHTFKLMNLPILFHCTDLYFRAVVLEVEVRKYIFLLTQLFTLPPPPPPPQNK